VNLGRGGRVDLDAGEVGDAVNVVERQGHRRGAQGATRGAIGESRCDAARDPLTSALRAVLGRRGKSTKNRVKSV
jgi:hypothetical protein